MRFLFSKDPSEIKKNLVFKNNAETPRFLSTKEALSTLKKETLSTLKKEAFKNIDPSEKKALAKRPSKPQKETNDPIDGFLKETATQEIAYQERVGNFNKKAKPQNFSLNSFEKESVQHGFPPLENFAAEQFA